MQELGIVPENYIGIDHAFPLPNYPGWRDPYGAYPVNPAVDIKQLEERVRLLEMQMRAKDAEIQLLLGLINK